MEEIIATLSKSLAGFCSHLQSSCEALTQSVDRRHIPLDSASSTFIKSLSGRVKSASGDLNLLESTSCGTVSFEELLGHCNEVYKKNQTDLVELEDHLKKFGYVPDFHVDDEDGVPTSSFPSDRASDLSISYQISVSTTGCFRRNFEEDALLDESLSLESVGLSDICLAALASEGNGKTYDPDFDEPTRSLKKTSENDAQYQPVSRTMGVSDNKMLVGFEKGEVEVNSKSKQPVPPLIMSSKDDFDNLPRYMKDLASWEDLLVATNKINSILKQSTQGEYYILQDEILSLDLGPKARSYVLLLVKLKRLQVETIDGLISYRVV